MSARWLLTRRASQSAVLGVFLAGPLAGLWLVEGNLSSSLVLGAVPLSDPFVLLQSLFAGHVAEAGALIGAAVIVAFYALLGGRAYCAFVCPVNLVTDAAAWLARRLGIRPGWQPARETRLWLLAGALAAAAATGSLAYELINPVSTLQRSLIFGLAGGWLVVSAVFLLDLLVGRHLWCGHLCPHGALYGLLGSASLVRVSAIRREACNDCLDCFDVCPEPHVIGPALRGARQGTGPLILSRDCTNCGRCIDVCDKRVFAFDFRFNNATEPAPAGAPMGETR
jgi:ferredoxin-type protein NapH